MALMNDPEATVTANEVKEKLGKALALVKNPEEVQLAEEELKAKL